MLGIVIKDSKIHGKGVFANKNFKKSEIVFRWDSLLQNESVVVKSPSSFLNHSCDANLTDKEGENIALRNINEGEEITCNYVLEKVPFLKMECACGSENCEKEIKGLF
jgi:hypothetical protein